MREGVSLRCRREERKVAIIVASKEMSLAKGIFGTVAKQYQAIVGSRVASMGLKYEDLLLESDDVEKALNRIPVDVKVAR